MSTVTTTSYRVVKTTSVGFGEDAERKEQIVWQGTDTKVLSKQCPPSEIFGADPLGHSEIEGGHIRFDYRFERLVDSEWQEIDDPRVRLTPMTELEREIDAENRRLFPGDFEQEDEYEDYEDPYGYMCERCHDAGCSHCEPEPEPCEKCGSDPCYCDVIAEQERLLQQEREQAEYEATHCPHCGGTPEVHAERVCSNCGECVCWCDLVDEESVDSCYFCCKADCAGGCYEEKYTLRVVWNSGRMLLFWRAYYWLRSVMNRRVA